MYYEGEVLLGKLHGKGKITSPDGRTLEGTFKEGFPEGEATVTLPNGKKYLIEVVNRILIRSQLIHPVDPRRSPFRTPNSEPVVDSLPENEFFPGFFSSSNPSTTPQPPMKSTSAILRFASRINASVPSRIVKADLSSFGRSGWVSIQFEYEGNSHSYRVPFTRPYTNQARGEFANLLNLNQSRSDNNLVFQEFIARATANYTVYPQIEVECVIALSVL